MYAAADLLGNEATITQNGRMLYARQITADGAEYMIYLTGRYANVRSYADLKIAAVLAAILILFAIFVSILFTNRFLTKFVWKRIEEPLDILVNSQRIVVHYNFHGLTDQEVPDYIRKKIRAAGGSPDILDTAAISSVHSYSQGNPV